MTQDVQLEAAGYPFRVRVYPAAEPDGSVMVWLHGGAFMFGTLDMGEADLVSRRLAEAGTSAVSVEYTLAPLDALPSLPPPPPMDGMPSPEELAAEMAAAGPRARFPVASLQVVAAFDWTVEHAADFGGDPARVGIGGASAGGNLAAGAAMRIKDRGGVQPAGLALVYPVLHAELPPGTPELDELLGGLPDALTFPPGARDAINQNYLGDQEPGPYSFPGGHDVSGLPPILIVTAERDRLRTSGESFAQEVSAAGGAATLVIETGALHGFLNEPVDATTRTVDGIRRVLGAPV